MSSFRPVLLTLLLAGAIATPAQAAKTASGTDPSGDGPVPQRDVTALSASFDPSNGAVSATLTLAAAPDSSTDAFTTIVLGTTSGSSCTTPLMGIGGPTVSSGTAWIQDDADGNLTASGSDAVRSSNGAAITWTVTRPEFVGKSYDCARVVLGDGSGNTTYDTAGVFGLTDPTPPPTTTTTPAPTPAPAPPAPAAPAPAAPAPAPKAPPKVAKLAIAKPSLPTRMKRNHAVTVKVKLTNPGTADAKSVKLSVGVQKGLVVSPRTRTIKTLKAGKSSTTTLKVRLTSKAKLTTPLSVKATGAGKLTASWKGSLHLGVVKKQTPSKKKPPAPVPTPKVPDNPLIGHAFWRTVNHPDSAWDNRGIAFVDDKWAYWGIPKGGMPTCTAVTAVPDKDGDLQDGCLNYTYDAKTGALTVGSMTGTFTGGTLKIGEDTYTTLVNAPAGATYGVELIHRGFQGYCGFVTGCTTYADYLTLTPDGQFALGGETQSSMGGAGGDYTFVGSYPPDKRGTYAIQAGSKIVLTYASGTVETRSFWLDTKAGATDPATIGLLMDDENFYKESD